MKVSSCPENDFFDRYSPAYPGGYFLHRDSLPAMKIIAANGPILAHATGFDSQLVLQTTVQPG
jgi:hypothetical protein